MFKAIFIIFLLATIANGLPQGGKHYLDLVNQYHDLQVANYKVNTTVPAKSSEECAAAIFKGKSRLAIWDNKKNQCITLMSVKNVVSKQFSKLTPDGEAVMYSLRNYAHGDPVDVNSKTPADMLNVCDFVELGWDPRIKNLGYFCIKLVPADGVIMLTSRISPKTET